MRGRRIAALVSVLALAALVPQAGQAKPPADVYEGGGYAAAAGLSSAVACVSTAVVVPQSATVSILPPGVSTDSVATGRASCAGNIPVAMNETVEVFGTQQGEYLRKDCVGSSCSVTVPAGFGVFRVMPSAVWTVPVGTAWVLVNPENNDSYCNYVPTDLSLRTVVCRASATGIS